MNICRYEFGKMLDLVLRDSYIQLNSYIDLVVQFHTIVFPVCVFCVFVSVDMFLDCIGVSFWSEDPPTIEPDCKIFAIFMDFSRMVIKIFL